MWEGVTSKSRRRRRMKMNRRMMTWMSTRKGMGVLKLYFAVNWSTSPASL